MERFERIMHQIKAKNISYNTQDKKILDNVSITIPEGKFVGIVGPNGSGKTTLLKHIYRAIPTEKNTIFLNGKALEKYSFRESAQQMTVMRQENPSEFDYSILEMVMMGRSPHRNFFEKDTREDIQMAKQALDYVGMGEIANQAFSTLSGGEKQRALIARSLAQNAEILIMDEPTNHLDVYFQYHLMQLVHQLGRTVISVFHDLNLAFSFCDYLYVMDRGKICAEGYPKTVITTKLLHDIFRIHATVVQTETNQPYVVIHGAATELVNKQLFS